MALPPTARRKEIFEIERIFWAAFTELGIKMSYEALDLWEDVPSSPRQAARAIERYLDQVLQVTSLRREHARRIAIPYYRLVRALWIGKTLQPLEVDESGSVVAGEKRASEDLDDLREGFYGIVETLVPEAIGKRPTPSRVRGDDKIKVDLVKDLIESLNELEDLLDQIAEDDLSLQSVKAADKLSKVSTKNKSAEDFEKESEDTRLRQGAVLAAKAQRSVRDGARRTNDTLAEKDPEAIGWIRVSESGTPCGFCAMLIARGLQKKGEKLEIGTLYQSEQGAERTATGEKYHDNCQCRAIAVFSEEQVLNDPQYDLNRKYPSEWPQVTKGLGGKDALAKWREHIGTAYRSQK